MRCRCSPDFGAIDCESSKYFRAIEREFIPLKKIKRSHNLLSSYHRRYHQHRHQICITFQWHHVLNFITVQNLKSHHAQIKVASCANKSRIMRKLKSHHEQIKVASCAISSRNMRKYIIIIHKIIQSLALLPYLNYIFRHSVIFIYFCNQAKINSSLYHALSMHMHKLKTEVQFCAKITWSKTNILPAGCAILHKS